MALFKTGYAKYFVFLSKQRNANQKFFQRMFSVSSPKETSQVSVGFIGLGNMGSNMASNLVKKGHRLVVYDVYPEAMSKLSDEGALVSPHPAELASKCDTIITMLPSSPHVLEVYEGENGIFQSVKAGTLLIDSSTIDPSVSKDLAFEAEKKGAIFLDAPVSGGINAAKNGTLTFMVGGKEKEYQAAQGLLTSMGTNIIHCGNVGSGQAAKICNNMMLAISMIGTAETMNLGIRLGMDAKLLANILNISSGRSWSSEVYNPVPGILPNVPASNNYEGGFGSSLMLKDLGLAQTAATRTASPTPLGSLAHQLYRILCNSGLSNKDFSSIYQFLQDSQNRKS